MGQWPAPGAESGLHNRRPPPHSCRERAPMSGPSGLPFPALRLSGLPPPSRSKPRFSVGSLRRCTTRPVSSLSPSAVSPSPALLQPRGPPAGQARCCRGAFTAAACHTPRSPQDNPSKHSPFLLFCSSCVTRRAILTGCLSQSCGLQEDRDQTHLTCATGPGLVTREEKGPRRIPSLGDPTVWAGSWLRRYRKRAVRRAVGGWPLAPDKQGLTVFQRGPSAPATAAPSLPVSGARQPPARGRWERERRADRQTWAGEGTAPVRRPRAGAQRPHSQPASPWGGLPSAQSESRWPRTTPAPTPPPDPHPEMKTPPRQRAVIRSAHEPLIHYEPRGRGN